MTFSWLNYPPWPPCPPCPTMLQMQMSWAGQIQYHFGRNISPETTSPGQSASSELTNVVLAPPKVLEMDWNQTEVTLYVRRRANLSTFCWYVTFWKFPSHSKILQTLTEGCGNRLSICQVRCVAVFVAPSYYISWHVQIERRRDFLIGRQSLKGKDITHKAMNHFFLGAVFDYNIDLKTLDF